MECDKSNINVNDYLLKFLEEKRQTDCKNYIKYISEIKKESLKEYAVFIDKLNELAL